jgi:DNA-binding winged helix-turn-helix (wHTH) protein/tetratricopeptide (TPR) repeat protein
MIFAFGDFSLDSDRRELRRGETLVAIEPQVFDVLEYLIARRERVVGKAELLEAIWQRRIISDSTLSSRIAALRRAVGDTGEAQRVIRTVARKGYRFTGTVHELRGVDQATPGAEQQAFDHAAAPAAPPPAAEPERRPVTIIACRMQLQPGLDPEDLADVVGRRQNALRGVAEAAGGTVTELTTDGAIVCFGYPHAREDDAERAVRVGMALAVPADARSGEPAAGPTRIGIATGVVVVEAPGSGSARQAAPLAVVGEAVHHALRLMGEAPANGVLIAESTRRQVGRLFEVRAVGSPAPNRTEGPGGAWLVVAAPAIASRFDALRTTAAPLIGREEEFALLQRRWTQVRSGEGRVVLIWGEAGIGKSRLVVALREAIGAEAHASLCFYCSPTRAQTALHPVIAQLEDEAGFSPPDSIPAKHEKLTRLLARAGLDDDADVALFAELLSIRADATDTPLALSARRRKELLFERFIARLSRLAERAPVLVVLEDAHWVDPTTRELFDIVIDRIRTLPVLLIMTYRPEFTPSWLGQSHVTALTLNRLGRRDNAALVACVAGRTLPAPVLDQIVACSEGVPLFVEEVTKSVLESGILRESDDGYQLAGQATALTVPATLRASLIARIDRLAPVRALVQTCAALGREFGYRMIRSVTGTPDETLQPLLEQLTASGLVHQRGVPPDATYIFKHALVQDAAYETMVKPQRARTHLRIVEVLRGEFPELAERHPDVLAHHCIEAGSWTDAIEFSIKAARIAIERSAGVEAEARVEKAITLLGKVASEPARQQLEGRLHVALADALIMTRGFASPSVMSALTHARAILSERDHPDEWLRALCGLYNYHLIRSESPVCLSLTLPLLKRKSDRRRSTVISYLAGTANLHLGEFDATIRHLQRALDLYDEDDCRPVALIAGYHVRSFILIWLGLAQLYMGSKELAAATIADAVVDARSRAHPFTLVSALLAQSRFCSHCGDFDGAIAAADEGLAIATAQRSPYHVSRANILRAINAVDGGEFERGIAMLEQALVAHRATGANFQSSYNLSRLAEAHARAGHPAQARELADAAIAEVERSGERWWEAEAHRLRGEILLLAGRGNQALAKRCFDRALAVARRQGAGFWEANALRSLAGLRPSRRGPATRITGAGPSR